MTMRDPKVSNVPNESKLQRALMPNSRMFLLFLILFAVITFFFSDRLWLSICEGVIILLLIIYSVIMRARKRRTLERYIESVTYDTESARNNTLQNFPLPMAVFRPADSQVIWANQNFFDLCGRHKPTVDMRITDVIPEFSGRWLLEGNTQCPELLEYQGHKYQIHGNLVRTNPDDAASYMGITYWVDVTDYEKIRLEYYASRPIIAVIVIDNYDELIRGLTDRKRNELRDAIEDKAGHQYKVITDLAAKGPCVIVGRCANFILKGRPNLFSVFLHADRTTRMQRVIENYGVEPGGAARAMDIMDSRRRTHCLHYTGQELGNARLYDLCVNTSDYGLERTVELILEAINTRTEQSSAVETVPVRSASFPEPEEDRIPGEISLA